MAQRKPLEYTPSLRRPGICLLDSALTGGIYATFSVGGVARRSRARLERISVRAAARGPGRPSGSRRGGSGGGGGGTRRGRGGGGGPPSQPGGGGPRGEPAQGRCPRAPDRVPQPHALLRGGR